MNATVLTAVRMHATGFDPAEIADFLKLTPDFVIALLATPTARRLQGAVSVKPPVPSFDLEATFVSDLPRTLRTLQDLRDYAFEERVRLSAAQALFDREAPKRVADDGGRHFHLHLSRADLREMLGVVREALPAPAVPAIDVTPEPA